MKDCHPGAHRIAGSPQRQSPASSSSTSAAAASRGSQGHHPARAPQPIVDLPLATLDPGPIQQSRPHLDPDRVSYYLEHLDVAAPVVVFDVDGVLLLADGHHRVAAAEQLGRTTVRADVRKGQRHDALQFAVDLAREQRGLTQEEVLEAISRRGRLEQR